MDYNEFDISDFLADENFVLWVTNPTEERTFFWNTWMSNHPDKLENIMKARELIGSVELKNLRIPTEQEFIGTLEKVMKNDNLKVPNRRQRKKNILKQLAIGWSVAASLLVGWLIVKDSFDYRDLFDRHSNTTSHIATITKVTHAGQKLTRHVLPDGSIISLNSGSKISYPEKFAGVQRELYLEGEAFFDVKKDNHRPFLVRANGSLTKVLGTSFNINAYPEENNVEIAVLSGKVAVFPWVQGESLDNQEMLLLNPNEMAIIKPSTHQVSMSVVALDSSISWKENILMFKNDSFAQVVKKLERWYGVKFNIDTQIFPRGKWNGKFRDNSLEYVLKGLMFSSDYEFEIDNTIVYVTDKKQEKI